jgi:hypothetical protein
MAARIRSARVRVGLDERAMTERLGISLAAYHDLESFDDEFVTCLSLQQVYSAIIRSASKRPKLAG